MKKNKTFILHDESVNSYGFRMLTSGADLVEFKKNPVMLYNHDDWDMPIGRWENIRIEDNKILAEAVFDLKDPKAARIAQKVEDGFIRACSIGAWVQECSSDESLRIPGQVGETVVRWSAREASICNIPANHNALALYDADGKRVQDADIPTILQLTDIHHDININQPNIENQNMKKELTSILNLSESVEDAALINEVLNLKEELSQYRQREADAKKQEATTLTDTAIRDGRLHASAREATLKLFDADHDSAKAMLLALPKMKSIAEQITNSDDRQDKLLKMSWDELDKSGKLADLRDKYPEEYANLYAERFGLNSK